MRIWAFPSFYPYDYPGYTHSGIFAHRQYKGLIENGAELTVIIPVSWNPVFPFSLLHPEWKSVQKMSYPYERVYDGIKVYHPRVANMKPSRFVKKSHEERYVECIVNFFKNNDIVLSPKTDVFYSQWLPSARMVQMAAHKLGVKSGVLCIGDDVVLWPAANEENRNLFEATLLEADFRFACADYLGKLANSIIGKDLHFDTIRRGVDYNFFKPVPATEKEELKMKFNIPAGKTVILTIGTASKRKGWIDLFDALVDVKKQNTDFILASIHTGDLEFDFSDETEKRGLKEHFIDLGERSPGELNKIFNLADIFCLPSHSEGIANVVIEAMSSGLPVITTTVGGHGELITNCTNGILIPPQKPSVLSEKLLALINNKEKRTALGAAAREHIVKVWGNFADNTKLLYERLCKI